MFFWKKKEKTEQVDAVPTTGEATASAPVAPAASPDVLQNIVKTETSETERLLEEAPEIDSSLLQEVGPPQSPLLTILKASFVGLVVVGIGAYVFFTSQFTDYLNFATSALGVPNISQQLASGNSSLINLQTSLNLYNYLDLKGALDKFSYFGDSYLRDYEISTSQTAENSEKADALEEMSVLKDKLKDAITDVKNRLLASFTAPLHSKEYTTADQAQTLFEQKLVETLRNKAAELANNSDSQAKRDYKNYMYMIKLVGNKPLRDLIVKADFDALQDKDLYKFIKDTNKLIVNDLSIIQEIKDKRIKWSDIINELKLRTMAVDSYYNENFYNEIGGIRYTSYTFDSSGPKIEIVGETKRIDTLNFTMIANLIDELNKSKLFKDAAMRNFSKSGSLDSGYTASLKLSLGLTTDAEKDSKNSVTASANTNM